MFIRPSGLSRSPVKPALFAHLGRAALAQISRPGPSGQSYVLLSGLLHACAYLYETGAILGHARQDRLPVLLSMSFTAEERPYCLAELDNLLQRRLETSGSYAHSFYTFYLHGTMRDMNMDFDVNGMREARRHVRDMTEAGHFLEYAGAEGLLLGGRYPDLAEKMYGAGYGAQEAIINEMTGGKAILPEETAGAPLREREQLILNMVEAYISRFHPGPAEQAEAAASGQRQPGGKRLRRDTGQRAAEAYLDIETTGLNPSGCDITVIGIHICYGGDSRFVQLVGKDITAAGILEALQGVSILYTYNGSRFDLPFIHHRLGIDLAGAFTHIDLMHHCWRNNLYGGLKSVERQLGIERRLAGIDGYQAVKLWWRYVDSFDLEALNTLLQYNREDVVNLKSLKERLC